MYCLGLTHSRTSTQSEYADLADGSGSAQMLRNAIFLSGKPLTPAKILSAAAIGEDWDQG